MLKSISHYFCPIKHVVFLSNKIQYICISLLLWTMHINTISDFIRSTHLIISWFIMIYRDLSWYIMIFLDKSWYITMYHDLSWFIMIYHDISWFPTVLGEVNDECHCHTDFCPINHLILACVAVSDGSWPQFGMLRPSCHGRAVMHCDFTRLWHELPLCPD